MKRLITIALCTFLSQMCTAQVMMLFSQDSLTGIVSPLDVDSLFYWFAADVGVTDSLGGAIATDEGVGTWNDLSGNGYHVTQSTDGARPVYKATGGPGSKPCIQFDGANDFLASAAHWWGSDDITIFIVMKFADATRNAQERIVCHTNHATNYQFLTYGNNTAGNYTLTYQAVRDGSAANSYFTRSPLNWKSTNYKLSVIINDGGENGVMYVDGTLQSTTDDKNGTGDGTIFNTTSPLEIGAIGAGGTPANFLQGSISEIIIYSRALSATERTAIELYLNRKYDLY